MNVADKLRMKTKGSQAPGKKNWTKWQMMRRKMEDVPDDETEDDADGQKNGGDKCEEGAGTEYSENSDHQGSTGGGFGEKRSLRHAPG